MVDRQAEPDPEEVGLSERLRVRSLDPFPRSQPPLLHESSVDPDQVPQRLILGVVGADDGRSVIAIPGDHHDLIRRSRVGMCHDRECQKNADKEQQKPFHEPIPLRMAFTNLAWRPLGVTLGPLVILHPPFPCPVEHLPRNVPTRRMNGQNA